MPKPRPVSWWEGASRQQHLGLVAGAAGGRPARELAAPPRPRQTPPLTRTQALLATELTAPADVVAHCLVLLRKGDLDALPLAARGPPPAVVLGGEAVREEGPLAALAGVLDVGARRVLPGHLLRRSRVRSSLQRGDECWQQRVELVACNGEESVFHWRLARQRGGSSSSSSSPWVVCSVTRDDSEDSRTPLPSTPHPRLAPERVVLAQLAALRAGDVLDAATYCAASGGPRGAALTSRRTSLASNYASLAAQLETAALAPLLRHGSAALGCGALPSQREMQLEVHVTPSPEAAASLAGAASAGLLAAGQARLTYVWRLDLQPSGCWLVSSISLAGGGGVLV